MFFKNVQKNIDKALGIKSKNIIPDSDFNFIPYGENKNKIGWLSHDKETRKLISEITKERMKGMSKYLSKKAKEDMKKNPERLIRLRRMASKPGKLNGMYGHIWTKEQLKNISNALKKQKKYTCVKCGVSTNMGNIKRWGHVV